MLLLQTACSSPNSFATKPTSTTASIISSSHASIQALAADNETVYLGGSDGLLMARQAKNGQLLWSQQISSHSIYLAAAGSVLYDAFDRGKSAVVEARQRSNGYLLWSQQVPLLGPLPLRVRDDMVYVNTSMNRNYGIVYALHASDGHVLWHYASGQVTTLDAFLYASDGIAAIFSSNGIVHVLHAYDGTQVLSYNAALTWFPVAGDGHIYIHNRDQPLQAFRVTDGSLLWTSSASGQSFDSWTVDNGRIYLASGEDIETLNGQDGTLLWQKSAGQTIIAGPVEQNRQIYTITQDGVVVVLWANDGADVWRHQIRQFHLGSLYTDLYADGILLFGPDKSTIDTWRSSDGTQMWHYTASTGIIWLPQIVNGMMFLWKFNGTLDVLDIRNGSILWRYLL